MKEQPNDLWRGGPWEQPSPSFPTPPPVVVPARRPPVLRVRRRRRTLLPFLALFLLVVGLSLGTVAVRWLLPWDDEPLTPHLSEQEDEKAGSLTNLRNCSSQVHGTRGRKPCMFVFFCNY